jgi:hypothetical protein
MAQNAFCSRQIKAMTLGTFPSDDSATRNFYRSREKLVIRCEFRPPSLTQSADPRGTLYALLKHQFTAWFR